jgi:hypothetical protein
VARNAAPEPGLTPLLNRLARLEAAVARIASQQRAPVAPVVSGAAKTTVTDADFESPQSDGALAVVVNTSDSTRRLATRQDGVWVVSDALS